MIEALDILRKNDVTPIDEIKKHRLTQSITALKTRGIAEFIFDPSHKICGAYLTEAGKIIARDLSRADAEAASQPTST